MPVSLDVLNTTLADLYAQGGNLQLTTVTRKPLMRQLMDKKRINRESVGGTFIERPFGAGSPAKGKRITIGTEVASLTRRQITKKYQSQTIRLFVPVTIPQRDLKQNDGKQGVVKLIKQYPMATAQQIGEDWEFYLLTGAYHNSGVSVIDSPDFDGAATLNGAVTSTGGDTGWLQQAAPASQTGNVQGVARDNAINHVNQFAQITSFASDGMIKVASAYDRAQQFSVGSGPDFGFADDVTYSNLQIYSADNVRITDTDSAVFGSNTGQFIPYKQAKIYNVGVNLDPTNASFTGTPGFSTSAVTGGVLYFLSSDFIEVPYLEIEEAPQFQAIVADQDIVVGRMYWDFQPMIGQLPSHAVIAGGRIP